MVGGDGERVGEHRGRSRKLATGSFGREEGRRRELRGRPSGDGANGGGGRFWTPWGLGLALGTGRGVEREVESSLAKQMEGRREGRGAWREKADSARRRRGGSASNLGVRAYGRRRVAMSRSFREELGSTR